jgi:hypothetical protein
MTIQDFKDGLTGALHGGTLNKVRNIELALERAANTLLSKIAPIDTIRIAALASTIYDDVYNYALPSDFRSIIDLSPQDNRQSDDSANRLLGERFDLGKELYNKTVSIEGSEGSKVLRANWRSRPGKVLNTMDSATANGTWSAVGSATGVAADTIFKVSGSASIKFTHVLTGDGIQNTTMTAIDLTNENRVADCFVWAYFSVVPTSVTSIWGNDLTTKYWTSVAQTTQADGTAFKVGWNLLKFSWSAATQTGTVTPSTINSFKLTAAGSALGTIRVDNIMFTIGRNFDIKYYSKYLLKNSSGTWISRTTADSDIIVLDNDAITLYHHESVIQCAHQMEASDSTFDIEFSKNELASLIPAYKLLYPNQSKKPQSQYGGKPSRGRW